MEQFFSLPYLSFRVVFGLTVLLSGMVDSDFIRLVQVGIT